MAPVLRHIATDIGHAASLETSLFSTHPLIMSENQNNAFAGDRNIDNVHDGHIYQKQTE